MNDVVKVEKQANGSASRAENRDHRLQSMHEHDIRRAVQQRTHLCHLLLSGKPEKLLLVVDRRDARQIMVHEGLTSAGLASDETRRNGQCQIGGLLSAHFFNVWIGGNKMISCEMQNLDAVCDLADRLHEQAKAPMEAKNLKISQLWIQRSNDERTHYAQTL